MAANSGQDALSIYLQYLPAIFQQDAFADAGGTGFINQLLLAFERILHGQALLEDPGIEEIIDRIHTYIEPGPDLKSHERTPPEYLPWLARWVALHLRDDWNEDRRRQVISRIVPLYRKRGTRAGLIEALEAYGVMLSSRSGEAKPVQPSLQLGITSTLGINTFVGDVPPDYVTVTVNDFVRPLQLSTTCTLGIDSWIGGAPQNYFVVQLEVYSANKDRCIEILSDRSIIALIDQYKPAHTYYDAYVRFPTMRLGDRERAVLNVNAGLLSEPIVFSGRPDSTLMKE